MDGRTSILQRDYSAELYLLKRQRNPALPSTNIANTLTPYNHHNDTLTPYTTTPDSLQEQANRVTQEPCRLTTAHSSHANTPPWAIAVTQLPNSPGASASASANATPSSHGNTRQLRSSPVQCTIPTAPLPVSLLRALSHARGGGPRTTHPHTHTPHPDASLYRRPSRPAAYCVRPRATRVAWRDREALCAVRCALRVCTGAEGRGLCPHASGLCLCLCLCVFASVCRRRCTVGVVVLSLSRCLYI